jgi:hypothetical protein
MNGLTQLQVDNLKNIINNFGVANSEAVVKDNKLNRAMGLDRGNNG